MGGRHYTHTDQRRVVVFGRSADIYSRKVVGLAMENMGQTHGTGLGGLGSADGYRASPAYRRCASSLGQEQPICSTQLPAIA